MSELVNVLLEHAERTSIPVLLYASGYWDDSRRNARLWEDFQQTLAPEQNDRLEALLERDGAAQTKEREAAFRAGLSVGLELSRL